MDYSGIIIERGDCKLLFQYRDAFDDNNPHKWGVFGGGIKRGETPIVALIRELKEELNIRIPVNKIKLIFKSRRFGNTYNIFYAKIDSKKFRMKQGEGESMEYFYPREIIFKKDVVLIVRLFMVFYPFIKWLNNI